jgi:hypothetical protein
MRSEFQGKITEIRDIEDAIRATHKYAEGLSSVGTSHPNQSKFPSRVFTKHYEVYPDIVVDWDMPVSQMANWLWGDADPVNVTFRYDYRDNKATM